MRLSTYVQVDKLRLDMSAGAGRGEATSSVCDASDPAVFLEIKECLFEELCVGKHIMDLQSKYGAQEQQELEPGDDNEVCTVLIDMNALQMSLGTTLKRDSNQNIHDNGHNHNNNETNNNNNYINNIIKRLIF